ncbi:unnamed protein product [Amoebophrya sp. A25]|nr:unnamed protein product [Amoebophrya sp. A25]|eukprot:GSA25T00003519001.1
MQELESMCIRRSAATVSGTSSTAQQTRVCSRSTRLDDQHVQGTSTSASISSGRGHRTLPKQGRITSTTTRTTEDHRARKSNNKYSTPTSTLPLTACAPPQQLPLPGSQRQSLAIVNQKSSTTRTSTTEHVVVNLMSDCTPSMPSSLRPAEYNYNQLMKKQKGSNNIKGKNALGDNPPPRGKSDGTTQVVVPQKRIEPVLVRTIRGRGQTATERTNKTMKKAIGSQLLQEKKNSESQLRKAQTVVKQSISTSSVSSAYRPDDPFEPPDERFQPNKVVPRPPVIALSLEEEGESDEHRSEKSEVHHGRQRGGQLQHVEVDLFGKGTSASETENVVVASRPQRTTTTLKQMTDFDKYVLEAEGSAVVPALYQAPLVLHTPVGDGGPSPAKTSPASTVLDCAVGQGNGPSSHRGQAQEHDTSCNAITVLHSPALSVGTQTSPLRARRLLMHEDHKAGASEQGSRGDEQVGVPKEQQQRQVLELQENDIKNTSKVSRRHDGLQEVSNVNQAEPRLAHSKSLLSPELQDAPVISRPPVLVVGTSTNITNTATSASTTTTSPKKKATYAVHRRMLALATSGTSQKQQQGREQEEHHGARRVNVNGVSTSFSARAHQHSDDKHRPTCSGATSSTITDTTRPLALPHQQGKPTRLLSPFQQVRSRGTRGGGLGPGKLVVQQSESNYVKRMELRARKFISAIG